MYVHDKCHIGYLKGSEERNLLENALQHRQSTCEEIPIIIDGKEYWTDDVHYQTMVIYLLNQLIRQFKFSHKLSYYISFYSVKIVAVQSSEKDRKILLCHTCINLFYLHRKIFILIVLLD